MLNVAIITSVHSVEDMRILWRQGCSLAKKNFHVKVYGLRGPQIKLNENLQTVVIPLSVGRTKRIVTGTQQLFTKALNDKPAIIHFHDPELIPSALLTKKRYSIPIVFDSHENYPEVMLSKHWLPRPVRPVMKAVMLRIERLAAKNFDAIITPTESLREKFCLMGGKAIAIKNYPSMDLFQQDNILSSKKTIDVIHVGMISEMRVKAFCEIITIVYKLRPQTTWKFVGIPARMIENFNSLLEVNVRSKVQIIGQVPASEIPSQLANSRIGVNFHPDVPQFRTAIPVKVLEYMAVYLPTVSTPIHELNSDLPPESAEQVGLFYTAGHEPSVVAHKLVEVLTLSEAELQRLGSNARQAVETNLSWESQASKLYTLYEEILSATNLRFISGKS
jgi:glycosyltransferase involved in cell wall biosynthesis